MFPFRVLDLWVTRLEDDSCHLHLSFQEKVPTHVWLRVFFDCQSHSNCSDSIRCLLGIHELSRAPEGAMIRGRRHLQKLQIQKEPKCHLARLGSPDDLVSFPFHSLNQRVSFIWRDARIHGEKWRVDYRSVFSCVFLDRQYEEGERDNEGKVGCG